MGPVVPAEQRRVPLTKKTIMLLRALVPPGIIVVIVLGSIFMGIAPPTEAAAVGALAVTVLVFAQRKLSLQVLKEVCLVTVKISSFAIFIGGSSVAFVGVFLSLGCGEVLTNAIMSAPGGKWGILFFIMGTIFILGMFVDWIGILFIIVPIISPIAMLLDFDPVWFGIMICVVLQTAFNTPPLATAIFYVKAAAAPELGVNLSDIIKGVIPFVGLILVGLTLCAVFPDIITWLPSLMIK